MRDTRAREVIVGTRGSALAVRQTSFMVDLLREHWPGLEFRVVLVQTQGDRVQDRPISAIGDKGVFVRALEGALVTGEIDIAVHSLKDVPMDSATPGLSLSAFSRREDPRDILVSASGLGLSALPAGARIGTSSLRRQVQLQQIRPDLVVAPIRGNVDSRLRKVENGEYDGVLVAAAGMHRLGLADRITEYLSEDNFVPDAGQGIIAAQTRIATDAAEIVGCVDNAISRIAATSERAVVAALEADCHSPVGALASVVSDRLALRAMAATEDGSMVHRLEEAGTASDAEGVGTRAGLRLAALLSGETQPYTGT